MDQKNSGGSATTHTIYILVIVILLAIIGGGFFILNKKLVAAQNQIKSSQARKFPGKMGGMPGMTMTQTTPQESDQQKEQVVAGISTDITKKTFNITGGDYYFVPKNITVNKGDTVTFVFVNGGGVHDLIIDELGVKTPTIMSGQTATATFTANKTGSFVYYCGLPGHRAKGMWGTLTVK